MDDGQPPPETLSVSQLNRQVKRLLESHFDYIWVEGELSNFVQPASGHWYFSLKDSSSQVRCAMFRTRNQRVRLRPANGEQVRIRAKVSLYEGRGDFQLIAEHMEPAGSGALQLAFEQLKRRLQAEGLFAPELKQALPDHPRHVGIITSPTGAAIRDILTVFGRRYPALQISILPVPVQGEQAAPAIVRALQLANASSSPSFDALIVARGGGSIEDLWAFNEESVARAIAASVIPVISAIGHEIDFTIADFVADARAPTPSAAAEMLSPDQQVILRALERNLAALVRAMSRQLSNGSAEVAQLRRLLRHPGDRLREQAQRLDDTEQRLRRGIQVRLRHQMQRLTPLAARLKAISPGAELAGRRLAIDNLERRLHSANQARMQHYRQRLGQAGALLDSFSPRATLNRGYALVTDEAGKIITDAADVSAGQRIRTRLAKGELESLVVIDE